MSDAELSVQTAFKARLDAGNIGCPIYDRVPDTAQPPYVVIGDDQFVSDKAEGLHRGGEVNSNVHVYFYGGQGKAGAKAIAARVKVALDATELDLGPDFVGLETLHIETHYLDEPDGKTTHAVLGFKTLLDAA